MNGDNAGDEGRSGAGATSNDLSARLKHLGTQLDRARPTAPDEPDRSKEQSSGATAIGRAFRMSSEFVAGVIAGGGLGWLFDRLLGTSPWGMIVFLMLGFAAGVFNVVRAAGPIGPSPGSKP